MDSVLIHGISKSGYLFLGQGSPMDLDPTMTAVSQFVTIQCLLSSPTRFLGPTLSPGPATNRREPGLVLP